MSVQRPFLHHQSRLYLLLQRHQTTRFGGMGGCVHFSGRPHQKVVLARHSVGRVVMKKKAKLSAESGITMIEVLLASTVLTIASMGLIGLIASSIATDTRNKFDSTTTMLAQSIVEQIASTTIGSGIASVTGCAGKTWTIDTGAAGGQGGAAVSNGASDWSETSPPASYHLDYVIKSPCTSTGIEQAVYDVRWNI